MFEELEKIRWNIIFKYLDIEFDGTVFEKYLGAGFLTVQFRKMELMSFWNI